MGFVFKQTVTRVLPTNATIKPRRRTATASELRKNPRQTTIAETLASWIDRTGEKRVGLVIEDGSDSNRVRVESTTYYARFRDGDGIVRTVPTGCKEKKSAMAILSSLTNRAELVKAKVITSDQANIADFQSTPLRDHITEYINHLRARKVVLSRIKTTEKRLLESSEGCSFRYLNELNADRLFRWLSTQVSCKTRKMSASVYNGYIQIWISFGNWCIGKRINGKRSSMNGDKRLLANPFDGMGKLDEQADRRRKARSLNEAELIRLLDATQKRPLKEAMLIRKGKRKGLLEAKLSEECKVKLARLGYERSLIYKTAILTGLRLNELRTLVVSDLSFGDVPFVKLQSGNEKSRKGSTLALRSDLAVDLQQWCEAKQPSDLVFYVPNGLLRILDRDLIEAGIPKIDAEGFVVHVHALRHSFGTHLSMAGVAPRTAQAAMRHSNISLTMNTYTDARLLDTAAAVECLPSLPLCLASGLDFVTSLVTSTEVDSVQNESIPDTFELPDDSTEERKNPANINIFAGFSSIGPAGFEPTTSTTPR